MLKKPAKMGAKKRAKNMRTKARQNAGNLRSVTFYTETIPYFKKPILMIHNTINVHFHSILWHSVHNFRTPFKPLKSSLN
jgi:hypothetical protein